MAKTKKRGKKARKRAGSTAGRKAPRHGSFILLDNAEKKAVIQELEGIEGMARGSEIELRIRNVRETLHNSTFSGGFHYEK